MNNKQLYQILVFAARYAHHRNTGAALAVCNAIAQEWDNLDRDAQTQIQRESFEAEYNQDDWQKIRELPVKES